MLLRATILKWGFCYISQIYCSSRAHTKDPVYVKSYSTTEQIYLIFLLFKFIIRLYMTRCLKINANCGSRIWVTVLKNAVSSALNICLFTFLYRQIWIKDTWNAWFRNIHYNGGGKDMKVTSLYATIIFIQC